MIVTIEDLIKEGDLVSITIPEENRRWGHNPFPDGTKATVIAFEEIDYGRVQNFGLKPGIYRNRSWVSVRLETGGLYRAFTSRLSFVDPKLRKKREKEWLAQSDHPRDVFLRELPDTPFWEGDFVQASALSRVRSITQRMPPEVMLNRLVVTHIDYLRLHDKTDDGHQYPAYHVSDSLEAGWNTYAAESAMSLLKRGNVWKFYHKEPMTFKDIWAEALFYYLIGEYDDVVDPETGNMSWHRDDALKTIGSGKGHGIVANDDFLTQRTYNLRVIMFRNPNVGRRIAQATLQAAKRP